MKCQKGKQCVKSPYGIYLKDIPFCTGCDKIGKDKIAKKNKKTKKTV